MLTYSIYRVLYGEDFFEDSVESIINESDKVFLFLHSKPWGAKPSINIYGKHVVFPEHFDNCHIIAKKLKEKYNHKIIIVTDDEFEKYIVVGYDSKKGISWSNSYLSYYNYICNNFEKPNLLLLPDLDIVMDNNVEQMINDFLKTSKIYGYPRCRSFYRHPLYQFKYTQIWCNGDKEVEKELDGARLGIQLINCDLLNKLDPNGVEYKRLFHFFAMKMALKEGVFLDYYCYNFGFCWNTKTVFWKLLVNLTQSDFDSESNPVWFKDKFLFWNPNTKNLEIAKDYSHIIPNTFKIDINTLPLSIRKRIENQEFDNILNTSNEQKEKEFNTWFNTII